MITFSFPLRENPENRQVVESTGTLMPIQLGKEPFETTLHARGYSFHLIFGNQINGWFLCVPNWGIGCELAQLDDRCWNLNSILNATDRLKYADAAAITWALSELNEYI